MWGNCNTTFLIFCEKKPIYIYISVLILCILQVLYLILFYLSENHTEKLMDVSALCVFQTLLSQDGQKVFFRSSYFCNCFSFQVLAINLQKISVLSFLIATSLFGWAIKQVTNVIQVRTWYIYARYFRWWWGTVDKSYVIWTHIDHPTLQP